jgi:two-component system, OmpR family, response regulator
MYKLLLVEDEKNFGIVLRDYLRMNGFAVEWATDGEAGLAELSNNSYDACIADIMMPRMDGFTLLQKLRATGVTLPVICLTARGMREDMLKGYRLGADDYLVKPFDPEILLMKLNAMLNRRSAKSAADEHVIGSANFDRKKRKLRINGSEVRLSPKECDLLHLLCIHRGEVLPRAKALQEIWKEDNYFTGRSMDVYIARLRKYLSSDPSVHIENVHGNGFSLVVSGTVK